MKNITVLFFATFRDLMGSKQIALQLPDEAGIQELKSHLATLKPGAAYAIQNALVAINREYAFTDDAIPDGAEVALFPHVSGG